MESTKCQCRQENPSHVGWGVAPPVAHHPAALDKVADFTPACRTPANEKPLLTREGLGICMVQAEGSPTTVPV